MFMYDLVYSPQDQTTGVISVTHVAGGAFLAVVLVWI